MGGEVKEWQKDAVCHECGEKGHIRPDCPKFQEDDESKEEKQTKITL